MSRYFSTGSDAGASDFPSASNAGSSFRAGLPFSISSDNGLKPKKSVTRRLVGKVARTALKTFSRYRKHKKEQQAMGGTHDSTDHSFGDYGDGFEEWAESAAAQTLLMMDSIARRMADGAAPLPHDPAVDQAIMSVRHFHKARQARLNQEEETSVHSKSPQSSLYKTSQRKLKDCQTEEATARIWAAKAISELDGRGIWGVTAALQRADIPYEEIAQLMDSLAEVQVVEEVEEDEEGDVNEHGAQGSGRSSWGTISNSGSVI